jgi:hypothetical protein
MSLEQDLAKVQVLVNEIDSRAAIKGGSYVAKSYLSGVASEAKTLYDNNRSAQKAIRGEDKEGANRHTAELCLSAKNLADNLSGFLQAVYGELPNNPKNLEANTRNAPTLDGEESIYSYFSKIHNHEPNSPLIRMRNKKGHGKGHQVLSSKAFETRIPSPYDVSLSRKVVSGEYVVDLPEGEWVTADAWARSSTQSYLEMARTVLETIADRETERLSPKTSGRNNKVGKQRIGNWVGRYGAPIKVAAAAALVTAGIGGTLAYQEIAERQDKIERGQVITDVVSEAYVNSTESRLSAIGNRTFSDVVMGMQGNLPHLGQDMRMYVNRVRAYSGGNLTEAFKDKIENFEAQKAEYKESLAGIKYDESSSDGIVKSLNTLSGLLEKERELIDLEKEVISTFAMKRYHGKRKGK